jgi:acyl carrier protein
MEPTEIEMKVRDYIVRAFLDGDAVSLDLDTQLLALGIIDSLRMFELTTFIEEEFGLLLEVDELVPANLESVRAISRMIHARTSARRGDTTP